MEKPRSSSTSNFKRLRRKRAAAWIGATFLVLGGWSWIANIGVHKIPALEYALPRALPAPPSQGRWYLAWDGEEFDQHACYLGVSGTKEHMHKARVLILGNSRVQFAMPSPTTTSFFEAEKVPFYNLGFSHAETAPFAMEIIRRHDLRPSLVIINVDGFFDRTPSPVGAKILKQSAWDTIKELYEKRASIALISVLSRLLPTLTYQRPERVIFRSAEHGSWHWHNWPDQRRPVPNDPAPNEGASPPNLGYASEVISELRTRGAQVILIETPGILPKPGSLARELSRLTGARSILPLLTGLTTVDGSHLSPDSGKRYASAVLEELSQSTEWKRLISPDPGPKR